jgi:hypothetical protein
MKDSQPVQEIRLWEFQAVRDALMILALVVLIWLGLLALAFVFLGLMAALVSVIWSLLRGRKPAMVTVFQNVRQASKGFGQGEWTNRRTGNGAQEADVVDVQAHEIRPSLPGRNSSSPD